MQETIIQVDSANPVDIFGINHSYISILQQRFPKLKIIARGNTIKLAGETAQVKDFEEKFKLLVNHLNKYNSLTEDKVIELLGGNPEEFDKQNDKNGPSKTEDVILFGPGGIVVKARTPNQHKLVEATDRSDMVFAIGPAGTGKTYTAVALAVRALKNKEVRRIVLTRPAVEAGEHLGFLPGDLKEKLDPYLQPLYDALNDMIPFEKLKEFMEKGVIQIAPLAFMRGRTLDHAFVILDEAQNATESQLKMFLTRMGSSAKFVITGDVTQIDLPRSQPSGLFQALKILKGVQGIEFIELDSSDVIRHKLVKRILSAYDKIENTKTIKK